MVERTGEPSAECAKATMCSAGVAESFAALANALCLGVVGFDAG
jgi:hypothetical protein